MWWSSLFNEFSILAFWRIKTKEGTLLDFRYGCFGTVLLGTNRGDWDLMFVVLYEAFSLTGETEIPMLAWVLFFWRIIRWWGSPVIDWILWRKFWFKDNPLIVLA